MKDTEMDKLCPECRAKFARRCSRCGVLLTKENESSHPLCTTYLGVSFLCKPCEKRIVV